MTSQSRTNLQNDINSKVASGETAGVSAQDVREVVTDLNDSNLNTTTDTSDNLTEGSTNLYNKVPTGGTSGQVLSKNSATNYDLVWADGGSGSQIINRSFDAEVSNTTSATDLYNYTVTGGTMNDSSVLELVMDGYIRNQSGFSANFRVDIMFGGGIYFQDNTPSLASDISDDYAVQFRMRLGNLGATNAQYMGGQLCINLNQDAVIGRGEIDSDEISVHGIIGSKADDIALDTTSDFDFQIRLVPSVADANFKWVGKIITLELK